MNKLNSLLAIVMLFILASAMGQPAPARYGKVDLADLEMKVYDLDTTAEAVILCDYGVFNTYNYAFQRLLRIKVLKKEGVDIVNRTFNISGSGLIKGCTYNLVDGAIVESKLKNESIYKEVVYEDRYRYRVTMPDVRVGSVVDITYSIPFLPNEWNFQDRVPVRWSELRIPSTPYVTFQKSFFGFQPLIINTSDRWVGKDMPALRSEPYLNSLTNYLTKVEIELQSVTVPGYYRFFTTSWDVVNEFLLEHQNFGDAMSISLFLNEEARAIRDMNLSDEDKMKAACDFVKQKVKWNQVESLYTSSDIGVTFRKGSGNSADINLMLVQLLKKLDFEVYPIALSTRENGLISPGFPTIDKLNYVIAGIKKNDTIYYLDATDPYIPAGMLPFRALNSRGRIIDSDHSDWVDLSPSFEQKETAYYDLQLSETGEITGTISFTQSEYEAYYFRKNFKSFNSQDEYLKDIESRFPGLTIQSYSVENIDSLSNPVKEVFQVNLTGYADMIGEMVSLNPMLLEKMESNPFKMEKRKYPIDYGHLIRNRYILNIKMPDGYTVTEMPKPINMVLPDKSARFTYQSSTSGNAIHVITNFSIHKTVFYETEYGQLKEFYNQIIAKQMEVIMLKKKI